MSKSLSGIFLPAVGGATLALGLAFGLANRDYGASEIALLQDRLDQVEKKASDASAAVSEAQAAAAAAAEDAKAEAARVAALEAEVAQAKSAAALAATRSAAPAAVAQAMPAPVREGKFGLGRTAHAEEVAAWDIDIRPDGTGLPEGSGDVLWGEEVFAEKCAVCHGDFAEGVDNWPKLAGGADTLADEDPLKTVGSYWPYLSTTWDYVNRSMPFGAAQTLEADEVYAIVAYILYSNDLVDEDFVLSNDTFLDVELPNADGFIIDDRIETEFSRWVGEPCMENCKDSVEVTMRAMVLDVTPEEEGAEEEAPAAVEVAAAEPEAPAEEAAPEVVMAALDPELVAKGEKVFKKCAACHEVGAGAKAKSGPILTGIVGAPAGAADGFKYSKPMKAAAEGGLVWDTDSLTAFLTKPKAFMKGTKMSFAGLRKEADTAAVIAYLQSASQ